MVDWDLATSTAQQLLPNGPPILSDEAFELVASLYAAAKEAEKHIGDITQMEPIGPLAKVSVVDRRKWAAANVEGFRSALTPLMDSIRDQRSEDTSNSTIIGAVGSRATAFQVGALLAYVGTKVLGQHELFTPADTAPRLLLIAPNVVTAERNLGIDPKSFRLWVCLHEQTHRVQLATVPWIKDLIQSDLKEFFDAADLDTSNLKERFGSVISSAGASVRGESGRSLLDSVQTPAQREILDRLVALMTLLEGHADWAMDEVGDDVISDIAGVRATFEKRRSGVGALDQIVRRIFGLDQKLAQYRDGAIFVRAVIDQVGLSGFNQVWTSPETLPLRSEIEQPHLWVQRVHGVLR